jgi:hypothetical protein
VSGEGTKWHTTAGIESVGGDEQPDHARLMQVGALHAPHPVVAGLGDDDVDGAGEQRLTACSPQTSLGPIRGLLLLDTGSPA